MSIKLELKNGNLKTTTYKVAQWVHDVWVTDDESLTDNQKKFLQNIWRIHWSDNDKFCLHRYKVDKQMRLPIGGQEFYNIRCIICDDHYTSEYKPHKKKVLIT